MPSLCAITSVVVASSKAPAPNSIVSPALAAKERDQRLRLLVGAVVDAPASRAAAALLAEVAVVGAVGDVGAAAGELELGGGAARARARAVGVGGLREGGKWRDSKAASETSKAARREALARGRARTACVMVMRGRGSAVVVEREEEAGEVHRRLRGSA